MEHQRNNPMKNNYEISDNLRNFISSNLELIDKGEIFKVYNSLVLQFSGKKT